MTIPRFMMRYANELPAELLPLVNTIMDLATDLRWTWSHAGDALWKAIDPEAWEQTENPFAVMQNLSPQRLQELNENPQFKERLQRLAAERKDYLEQPGWYGETHADAGL